MKTTNDMYLKISGIRDERLVVNGKTLIDADRLIARIMRLSGGRLTATWTAAGIVKVIEEERAENVSLIALITDAECDTMTT